MNVVSVTNKILMVVNHNPNSKVARRSAVYACITKASCRNNLTVINTGRNVDVNLCLFTHLASACTFGTRLFDNLACAVTGRTRSLSINLEKAGALLNGNVSPASALSTGFWACALCRTRAVTLRAILNLGNLYRLFAALSRLLKRNVNSGLNISSALRSIWISASKASASSAEEAAENVAEVYIAVKAEAACSAVSALSCRIIRVNSRKAELVIFCSFVRV